MKINVYECECGQKVHDIKRAGWIEITSEAGDITYTNYGDNADRRLITKNSISGIHFCSKKCVVESLFMKSKK